MADIKLLSSDTINKIAAGEVVDRPSSVIKELVENSIDAGATEVIVRMENGGQNLISVTDNGCGIDKHSLALAVERHATSKLSEDDIANIEFFGFRGEALPSIGAVSKLAITSKTAACEHAYRIEVSGGVKSSITPAGGNLGTTVEVRDLFSYTPARLKFLKSPTSEKAYAVDLIQRFSLAHPTVGFTLIYDDKTMLSFRPNEHLEDRLKKIFSKDFISSSCQFKAANDSVKIHGYAGLPTLNSSTTGNQFTFVNGRSIRDKLLYAAIKASYQGLVPAGRHPMVVLYLELDPYDVDVNVHPTKAEVRFKEVERVRNLIIGAIRKSLRDAEFNHAATPSLVTAQASAMHTQASYPKVATQVHSYANPKLNFANYSAPRNDSLGEARGEPAPSSAATQTQRTLAQSYSTAVFKGEGAQPQSWANSPETREQPQQVKLLDELPLGYAKFQIANKFIIAENSQGLILVDQHAAHERIVLEQFKAALAGKALDSQLLAIPQIENIGVKFKALLLALSPKMQQLGLIIESFADDSIAIRAVPLMLKDCDVAQLIRDSAEELMELEDTSAIEDRLLLILSNHACHHSIRSGRKMTIDEMNHLLRQIESTDFSGQCNHGRPTYRKLTLKELEKMFERT